MPVETMSPDQYRELLRQRRQRRSKHNVDHSDEGKAERTRDGKLYASVLEADFHDQMKIAHAAGHVSSWEEQVRIPLVVNGTLVTTYVADFLIYYANGNQELVDTKGQTLGLAALKINIYRALKLHPPLRIVH